MRAVRRTSASRGTITDKTLETRDGSTRLFHARADDNEHGCATRSAGTMAVSGRICRPAGRTGIKNGGAID
jgi:hypothetical protein